MAGGVALGFLSHLVLDELYSVEFSGIRLRLNQAAGSAFKLFGKSVLPNLIAYSLLAALTYTILIDVGILNEPNVAGKAGLLRQAVEQAPDRR